MSSKSSSNMGLVFTYSKVKTNVSPMLRTTTRYRTLNMHNSVNNNISSMNSIINSKPNGCSACGN